MNTKQKIGFILSLSIISSLAVFLILRPFQWETTNPTFPPWMFVNATLEDDWTNSEFADQWWELYAHGISEDGKYRILLMVEIYYKARCRLWITITNLETQKEYFFQEDSVGNEFVEDKVNRILIPKGFATAAITLSLRGDGYRVCYLNVSDHEVVVETWSRGIPLWLGKDLSTMPVLKRNSDGTEMKIGGYADCVKALFSVDSSSLGKITFDQDSYGLFSHIWIHPYNTGMVDGEGHTGLYAQQQDFYLVFTDQRSLYSDKVYFHDAVIGFDGGDFYRFNNFEVESHGDTTHPDSYNLTGIYEDGSINIVGVVLGYLSHPSKRKGSQDFWDRPYIHWTGTVTKGNQTINVEAFGSGENLWFGIQQQ